MNRENDNFLYNYDLESILPTNDLMFKKIFWNKEYPNILISFINAVLKRAEPIVSVDLINTELDSQFLIDHGIRLDLIAKTSSNELLNIEMQKRDEDNMYKRTLYYWSKIYSSQLNKGQEYNDLRPVITINILDFVLFNDKRCHRSFILKDKETNEIPEINNEDLKMIEIHFVELKKRKYMDQNDDLWAWAEFLKAPNSKNLDEKKEEIKSIRDAQNVYDIAVADPTEREKIRLLDKTQRDNLSYKKAQITKARERGIKKGKKEGLAEGKKVGLVEGEYNAKIETAKKMLLKGLGAETISECTGLSLEEVQKLTC